MDERMEKGPSALGQLRASLPSSSGPCILGAWPPFPFMPIALQLAQLPQPCPGFLHFPSSPWERQHALKSDHCRPLIRSPERNLIGPYKGSHAFKDPGIQVNPGLHLI